MGTHPIFESDFDCLTEREKSRNNERVVDDGKHVYGDALGLDETVRPNFGRCGQGYATANGHAGAGKPEQSEPGLFSGPDNWSLIAKRIDRHVAHVATVNWPANHAHP